MQGLVADIGGTNARFAMVEDIHATHPKLSHCQSLQVAEHATLSVAIERYLEAQNLSHPKAAGIAVASPVLGDRVRLTNNNWQFSQAELSQMLGFEELHVLNDFAAQALALPHLREDQLKHIRNVPEPDLTSDTLAVLGPGTGLGVAGLHLDGPRQTVFTSEGGHMSFAPLTPLEFEIAQVLSKRYERVSFERLLCGQGVRNLYEALTQIKDVPCEAYDPAQITEKAVEGSDHICVETLELFCAILGTFAGDVALMLRARHVYIGGGIVPRFIDFFKNSAFRERFEAKGRFLDLMRRTPVSVIIDKHPGLIGAAASLNKEMT